MLRTGAQTSSVNYCACLMSRCGDICPPKRPPNSGDVPAHGVRQRRARSPRAGLPRLPGNRPIHPASPGLRPARPQARTRRTRIAPTAGSTRVLGEAPRTARVPQAQQVPQPAPPQVFHVKPLAAHRQGPVGPPDPDISPPSNPNDSTTATIPSARAVRAVTLLRRIRLSSALRADAARPLGLRHAPPRAGSAASASSAFSPSCSSSS